MIYEVWDLITRNQIAAYDTETEALAFVRAGIEELGREWASGLALVGDPARGPIKTIAKGEDLAGRALGETLQPPRQRASREKLPAQR